jgi:hypothetical protein
MKQLPFSCNLLFPQETVCGGFGKLLIVAATHDSKRTFL